MKLKIFPKELVHGIGKKIEILHRCILGIISQKNVFYIILERKKRFKTIKNRKFKSRRIRIFPKELVHGFGQKFEFFPPFFFKKNRPGKHV